MRRPAVRIKGVVYRQKLFRNANSLQNFVRLDNLSFTAELEKSGSSKPMTPKRKADEAGDDELEPEQYGLPPLKRNGEILSSNVPSESSPPPYLSHPPSPPFSGSEDSRTPTSKGKSSDEVIPISLRSAPSTIDPSMLLDRGEGPSAGQEMQDRGRMMAIGQPGSFTRGHGYRLGNYMGDTSMDDDDFDDIDYDEPRVIHIEYA
jgi:hypothetical protein